MNNAAFAGMKEAQRVALMNRRNAWRRAEGTEIPALPSKVVLDQSSDYRSWGAIEDNLRLATGPSGGSGK